MVRKFKLQFVYYFFLLLLFNSCHAFKPAVNLTNLDYLNYDKLKVSIKFNNESYKLKGYINLVKDSDICFRFWGFMGYEVCKGHISDNFILYDLITNKMYSNYKSNIENSIGLIVDKHIFIYLLKGELQDFSTNLIGLNKGILQVTNITDNSVSIFNTVTKGKISIFYKYTGGFVRNLSIRSDLNGNKLDLKFEMVEMSTNRKYCNF